jgi:hypothetical protein
LIWSTPEIAFQEFVLGFLCHFGNCTEAGGEELGDVKEQLYWVRLLDQDVPSVVSIMKKERVGSRTLVARMKGTLQKAKRGGTPGMAPIGYLNVREVVDGREVRTIALDPERAPLVQWAFEAYASDYTMRQLVDELAERGLRSKGLGSRRSKPLTLSRVSKMLGDRYYVGIVTFAGQEYEGRHERLIEPELFERVAAVRQAHFMAGERNRIHEHYLKGSLRCGQCGSRLMFPKVRGHGGVYDYFFCLGRQRGNRCRQPYVAVEAVEAEVEKEWLRVQLKPGYAERLRELLVEQMAILDRYGEIEAGRQRKRLDRLDGKRRRLVELALDGTDRQTWFVNSSKPSPERWWMPAASWSVRTEPSSSFGESSKRHYAKQRRVTPHTWQGRRRCGASGTKRSSSTSRSWGGRSRRQDKGGQRRAAGVGAGATVGERS